MGELHDLESHALRLPRPLLTAEVLKFLEEHHLFTGLYSFKVIDFVCEDLLAAACASLGPRWRWRT